MFNKTKMSRVDDLFAFRSKPDLLQRRKQLQPKTYPFIGKKSIICIQRFDVSKRYMVMLPQSNQGIQHQNTKVHIYKTKAEINTRERQTKQLQKLTSCRMNGTTMRYLPTILDYNMALAFTQQWVFIVSLSYVLSSGA